MFRKIDDKKYKDYDPEIIAWQREDKGDLETCLLSSFPQPGDNIKNKKYFAVKDYEKVLFYNRGELIDVLGGGIYELDKKARIKGSKAIQTAIYHDFGKVPFYTFKLDLQYRKIYTNKVQRQEASLEIIEKFNYVGYDSHVDECIAVLKRYNLPFDDEMYQAIIFHHGKWAKYKPFEPTKLSELIHVADMITSHVYDI